MRIERRHIDALGDLRSEIRDTIQFCAKPLEKKYQAHAGQAIALFLRAFFTEHDTRAQRNIEDVVQEVSSHSQLSEEEITGIFDYMVNQHILASTPEKLWNFTSNRLASIVLAQLALDSQNLMAAEERFDRFYVNYLDSGSLMQEHELALITPFIPQMTLDEPREQFVKKSKQQHRKEAISRYVILTTVLVVLLSLLVGVLYQMRDKQRQQEKSNAELTSTNSRLTSAQNKLLTLTENLKSSNDELILSQSELKLKNDSLQDISIVIANKNQQLELTKTELELAVEASRLLNESLKLEKSNIEIQNKQLDSLRTIDSLKQVELAELNADLDLQRTLAITRTVANEAANMNPQNSHLKALLAYHAYAFNANADGGNVDYPGIYKALYRGARDLQDEFFNIAQENPSNPLRSIEFDKSSKSIVGFTADGQMVCVSASDWNPVSGISLPQIGRSENSVPVRSIWSNRHGSLIVRLDGSVERFSPEGCTSERITNRSTDLLLNPNFAMTLEESIVLIGRESIIQFDPARDEVLRTQNTTDEILSADLAGVATLVLGMSSGKIGLLDLNDENNSIDFLEVSQQGATAVDYFDYLGEQDIKGYLASGYADGSFHIWYVRDPDALVSKSQARSSPAENVRVISSSGTHDARITDIAVSPDRSKIAVSSLDGTVSIWDTEQILVLSNKSYAPIIIDDHDGWVNGIVFSADSKMIMTSCSDGKVRAFNLDPAIYAEEICSSHLPAISADDWTRYFGDSQISQTGCDEQ